MNAHDIAMATSPSATSTHTGDRHAMLTVRQIVHRDQRVVYTILPESSVQAAVQLMASERVSALPVVKDGVMVGIVSERDYVRKVASQRIPAWTVKVHEIMTREVITVTLEDTVRHCMSVMVCNRIRHLPVMEAGQLTAIISITDVVRALKSEQL